MPKFVSTERVPVQVEGDPNTIYIKPKMDYGTRQRVMSAGAHMKQGEAGGDPTADFDLGAYNIALLTENVVGWEGPQLDTLKCTPANILSIDPDDPLLEAVLKEINDRNKSKSAEDTSPNLSMNGRSPTTETKEKASKPQDQ